MKVADYLHEHSDGLADKQYDLGINAFNAGKPLDESKNLSWRIGWKDAKEFFEKFGRICGPG